MRLFTLEHDGRVALGQLSIFRRPEAPIDLKDPIGGALQDADLLLSFAAQSCKNLEPKKIQDLTEAIAIATNARKLGGTVNAADSAAFWQAYDALAVEMLPLSAHSIRASIRVNARRFPSSLLTPSALNAAFAIFVFFAFLILQGFWVAGKELMDKADALDTQKVELSQRISRNGGAVLRDEARANSVRRDICLLAKDCVWMDGIDIPDDDSLLPLKKPDSERLIQLLTEKKVLRNSIGDKAIVTMELTKELEAINDRNRPLEALLQNWYGRARSVCAMRYLEFLCPLESVVRTSDASARLEKQIAAVKSEIVALDKTRDAQSREVRSPISRFERVLKIRQQLDLEGKLAKEDADRFRGIVQDVRILVANISAYLIPLLMGLLGALTFILRTLSQQLRDHTYVPTSASVSIVRICLGAIAGVFGSLLAPGNDVGLKTLPPVFIPFVFGYGIEILFSLLDRVVRTFTQSESTKVS